MWQVFKPLGDGIGAAVQCLLRTLTCGRLGSAQKDPTREPLLA